MRIESFFKNNPETGTTDSYGEEKKIQLQLTPDNSNPR